MFWGGRARTIKSSVLLFRIFLWELGVLDFDTVHATCVEVSITMYDIEFFLSHKCLCKNRTFVCNKFAEIDIKLSKCILLTQSLFFHSKLQIWKRTIASRPINCTWNCRTKINNTVSCCNMDICLMWVEQQRSVIWVNHRALREITLQVRVIHLTIV